MDAWVTETGRIALQGGPLDGRDADVDIRLGRLRGSYALALVDGNTYSGDEPDSFNHVPRPAWRIYRQAGYDNAAGVPVYLDDGQAAGRPMPDIPSVTDLAARRAVLCSLPDGRTDCAPPSPPYDHPPPSPNQG